MQNLKQSILDLKYKIVSEYALRRSHPDLLDDIIIKTSILNHRNPTFRERLYFIMNELYQVPLCQWCKIKEVNFIPDHNVYTECCSRKCASLLTQPKNQHKRVSTLTKRYGIINPSQLRRIQLPENIKEQLNIENLKRLHYEETLPCSIIAKKIGVSATLICKIFRENNCSIIKNLKTSVEQFEIEQFLSDYTKVISNDRNQLTGIDGLEIDIYLPEYKIGIEVNGCYYHSSKFKLSKNYHYDKYKLAEKSGIRLFQFYDKEWRHKKDIIKSMLLNNINKIQRRIYGRETKFGLVTSSDAMKFYDNNHLQGKVSAQYHYGLFYNNELVSLMSFSKSRFNKNYEWELVRFCSLLNSRVVGSATKLFSNFIKIHKPSSVISYADLRISRGDVYDILNFTKNKIIRPDYKYYYGGNLVRKEHFRHSRLKHILKGNYDPTLSERRNTENNCIWQVYDAGKIQFIWISKNKIN